MFAYPDSYRFHLDTFLPYYFPPYWIKSFIEVYKQMMNCLIVFPFFLKYITNPVYMITSLDTDRSGSKNSLISVCS